MQQLCARGQLVQMTADPGEHVVLEAGGGDGRLARVALVEGVTDLVQRRRDGDPEEESDRADARDEEEEDRHRLRNAAPLEPFDSRPDRGREGQCKHQQDHDGPHLPEAEGKRDDGDSCCRRLGGERGDIAVRSHPTALLRLGQHAVNYAPRGGSRDSGVSAAPIG